MKVFNRQRHPITPDAAPSIAPFSNGEIDETLPRNQALIDSGAVQVLPDDEQPQLVGDALRKRAADLDIDGRSSMSADELRAAIAAAENNPDKEA